MEIESIETDMKPNYHEIALRAYQLWEEGGRQPGRDQQYWLQAEAELKARQQPRVKATASTRSPIVPFPDPKPEKSKTQFAAARGPTGKRKAAAA